MKDRKFWEEWNDSLIIKYNPENYYSSKNPLIRYIINKKARLITDFINSMIKEESLILDVGCGTGEVLSKINRGLLYGCDISRKAIELSKAKLKDKATLFYADAYNLKYYLKKEGLPLKFDYIVCSEVLEHVEEPRTVIKSLLEVSKDTTKIVLTIPNEKNIGRGKKIFLYQFKSFLAGIDSKLKTKYHLHAFDLNLLKSTILGLLNESKIYKIPKMFVIEHVIICEPIPQNLPPLERIYYKP